MTMLRVVSPGTFTTLQDAGRVQWQHMGVPPSGPMDEFAFRLANALVGNPLDTGALELTLQGGRYVVEQGSCRIAVAGDFEVLINNEPVPTWQAHDLNAGDVIAIGRVAEGWRGYLAVAGGFDVAPQLDSVSTLLRAQLGGFAGRHLAKGDVLPLRAAQCPDAPRLGLPAGVRPDNFPWYRGGRIRVVAGPQASAFSEAVFEDFCCAAFRITPHSDRMGYRLAGPVIQHAQSHEIITEAIAAGSIQIPGDGQPIIALCDRQTTGGYPKIATVIRADLSRLGQMKPGDSVRFRVVSVDDAENSWRRAIELMHCVSNELKPL